MKDSYSILGVPRNASIETIKDAYRELARKYHPDNYSDDDPLKSLATEKMQEINAAYEDILANFNEEASRANGTGGAGYTSGSASGVYADIRKTIHDRRFREAETLLSRVAEADRTADWHYLESLCLMSRGFVNDAMRELEIACSMEPDNQEYQQAKQMFNQNAAGYGRAYRTTSRASSGRVDGCDMCMRLW